ncbi:ABC transporter permease [Microvirga brassicacearum]|uniref:ABC transporter permease subunit n=1 Tax=Microvirga brassicacearum TaxID=2580413 RepID=A0A5N3PE93_9HYPH|nr:ABC transporter permease subunit [Microvirga brassicacearum]KAB0268062.1 ABC transporter permease subunit [Microvirga brassicacearum]
MRKIRSERAVSILLGITGIGLFLALWETIGQFRLLGLSWPPITDVLAFLQDPSRWPLFSRALGATLEALVLGYIIGLFAGVLTAMAAYLLPPFKPGLDRTSAFIHAVPSIALAPLLIIFLGRNSTPSALAALSTFFVLYVATSSGLASTERQWDDLLRVLGASRLVRFRRLNFPAALPTIASGMRLAAPASLIGVIVGEWFGAPRGIGVLIINAMQNFQIPLLWSAVLLTVLVSLMLFGALGFFHTLMAERFR